ncbi:MAG: hypothetical protein ACOCVM_09605 [Desulfovibrionaceae bacterium]
MTALTKDRDTKERDGVLFVFPVAAASALHAGGMAALDASGNAVPASADAALTVVGRVEEAVDNTAGAAGDQSVHVKRGVFCFANSSAGDEITRADIGEDCYVVDDQTVAKTSDTNARPKAGVVMDVDAAGVWVRI